MRTGTFEELASMLGAARDAKARRSRRARARGGLEHEVLAALVARDLSIREIAEQVDRSPTTVRYWLQFHGLATTRAARRAGGVESVVRDGESVTRFCKRHGEARHVRRDGRLRCTRCLSDAVSDRRRAVKRIVVEEAGGACIVCGYDRYVGALQFHHLDPETKRFSLGLKGAARALNDVREEARKCVLLCANCHAEVEGGVRSLPSRQPGRG